MSEPITREETYLAAIAGDGVDLPNPITREELYLAAAAGMAVELPNPITRKEQFLQRVVETGGSGGGGVTIRNQNKTITQNGQYKADSGYTGLGTVTVNVPQEDPVLQDKTATQNGKYTADSGFDGLGTVTVDVPEPVLQDKTVTENGEYTADSGYDGLGTVTVSVPQDDPVLQDKTVTENGEYTADSGYDGLGTVTVNVEASGGGDDLSGAVVSRSITEYANDKINVVGDYAFYTCYSLTSCDIPNATAINPNGFMSCTKLTEINCPKVNYVKQNAFQSCVALNKLDIVGDGIFASAFTGCKALATLILRKTSGVVSLANVNAFNSTPFASGGTGGTVYCPAALITQYQQATNWSTLYAAGTCNFVAIEGSEYE